MSPVIRISDETWERLKSYARPLEDSAEDVVRLALDALDQNYDRVVRRKKTKSQRLGPNHSRNTNKLPQKEFRVPLLRALSEKGGKASAKEIRDLLEPRMAYLFSEADYASVSSGDPRWWNAVCWERNALLKEGLLRSDSVRGIWELSDMGELAVLDLVDEDKSNVMWRDDITTALRAMDNGEGVSLRAIYDAVRNIRVKAGRSVPEKLEATVRRTLEDNCAESSNFRGKDIFCMPKGKGAGVWALR